MIGKTVGKYRVIERLGRGGMGTVYKAVDETLDREVAIKVLNPDLGDPDVLKRFRAEAVTLARLNHPGIATIYELDRSDDDLLMVMEFVRGETFQEMSERLGPLAVPQAAHLCSQVLEALGHAHRAGIVHRDLKPANLMITETGAVKVMDFGIARVLGSEHVTHAGYMMGTPAYMAPEQVLGGEIDGRADLYAIGVVFFRLLTGQLPFKADTAVAMVQKQLADEPTPLATFRPDLPLWCTAVMHRALAKSPAERFQTAEEFRSALTSGVTPASLGELPTVAEPTPHGLQIPSGLQEALGGTASARVAGGTSEQTRQAMTPGGAPIPQTVRHGPAADPVTTTVVLGRTHLYALGAVALVLLAGVAVLGYVALKRSQAAEQQTAAVTQPVTAGDTASPGKPQEHSGQAGSDLAPTPQTPVISEPVTSMAPAPSATQPPPAAAAEVSKTAPRTPRTTPPPSADDAKKGARRTPPASPGPAPAAKPAAGKPATPNEAATMLPVLMFEGVRLLVADGQKMREREGLLLLDTQRATILDKPGGTALASVPYASLSGAFLSRSKQPRWRDAQGKDAAASADLGKLGFLKSERNWLILVTAGAPVIFRCEDADLQKLLAAFHERSLVAVQRYAPK